MVPYYSQSNSVRKNGKNSNNAKESVYPSPSPKSQLVAATSSPQTRRRTNAAPAPTFSGMAILILIMQLYFEEWKNLDVIF